MNVNIGNMTLEDINLIETNFSENFDKFWSINILKEDLKNNSSRYIIAKIDNQIVGFAGIKIIFDEADIMNIAVKIDKRKLGIGSLMLQYLIHIANDFNCKVINLEVNENNIQAIHLYEKFDFKRIALRKKYYNNTDNAIIMQKQI